MNDLSRETAIIDDTGQPLFSWRAFRQYLSDLRGHMQLLYILSGLFGLIAVGLCLWMQPEYTAVAIIGPPGPSPTDSFLTGVSGGAGAAGGIAKRLLGGSGTRSATDPFEQYVKLLHSNRLAKVLVEKDNLLPVIYAARWDSERNAWRPRGPIHAVTRFVYGLFGRHVRDNPDIDTMTDYLNANLKVDTSGAGGAVRLSSLLSESSYPTVKFVFKDPRAAEKLLTTILNEADELIRQDLRRDVAARLTFLRTEIPTMTMPDQRDAIISVMSGQEQLEMMLEADKRFASTLIDPPYASDNPTSPQNPLLFLIKAIAIAAFAWALLVYLDGKYPSTWSRFVYRFEHPFRRYPGGEQGI